MNRVLEQVRPVVKAIVEEEMAVGTDNSVGSRIMKRVVEEFDIETGDTPYISLEVLQTEAMLLRGEIGLVLHGLPPIPVTPVRAGDRNCETCKWQVGSSCRAPYTLVGVDCWAKSYLSWEPSDTFLGGANVPS